jgi:tape measure domain-containing protein
VATIRTSIQLQNGITPVLKSVTTALNMTISSFEELQGVANNAINTASITAARQELAKSEIAINGLEQEIREAAEAQNQLNDTMNAGHGAAGGLLSKVKGIAAGLGVGIGVSKLMDLSDTMTSTTARLDLINDGLQTTRELQDMIYDSANNSRTLYTDTAQIVSKLGLLAGDAFGSNQETVAFAEQMNKQFKISGASIQEQTSGMYQLTQAMAAGRLQGDEFRSVMENAPMLARSIAEYMGLTVGELKDVASEGLITSEIIKNAMFNAADETNAQFERLPMTFSQVGTTVANTLLQTFDPVIQGIGRGAQWIGDNWSDIQPIFFGAAAGATAYAIAIGIVTASLWLAEAENKKFMLDLLKSPWTWVAVGIGIAVGAIYKWVQSVGGAAIAWEIAKDKILYAWDLIGIGVMTGVYGIGDFMGYMKVSVLTNLQEMVNGSIGLINEFIKTLNLIPGVNFDLVDNVTFGTTAQLEEEAAKRGRADALENLKYDARLNHSMRQMNIDIARENAASKADSGIDYAGLYNNTYDTAENTSKIADSMEISEEELKYIRDMAERETVNRFTTAEVKVEMTNHNNISSDMDIDGVIDIFGEKLEDSIISIAEGVHE